MPEAVNKAITLILFPMEDLIPKVPLDLIEAELNDTTFLKKTKKAGNEIYVISNRTAPNTLREMGRLREYTFRAAGGGSGKSCDLDRFDLDDPACGQIIVWDPEEKDIIGGYRFTLGRKVQLRADGQPDNNMAKLFEFTPGFCKEYLPDSIEMARAFVQPKYQSVAMRHKSLFSLDNLWEGIGALVVKYKIKYLMGKVSVYYTMKPIVRDAILYFLQKSFPDNDCLIRSRHPHRFSTEDVEFFEKLFCRLSYRENYKALNIFAREQGEVIPPLIHAYVGLSNTMRTFGTCLDPSFGNVYDTALMITLADIHDDKKERYLFNE